LRERHGPQAILVRSALIKRKLLTIPMKLRSSRLMDCERSRLYSRRFTQILIVNDDDRLIEGEQVERSKNRKDGFCIKGLAASSHN
jgi:hypothetical protein